MPDRPAGPLVALLERVRSEQAGSAVRVRPDLADIHARGHRARRRRRAVAGAATAVTLLVATVAVLTVHGGLRLGGPELLEAADLGDGATLDPVVDTTDLHLEVPGCGGAVQIPKPTVSHPVVRAFAARSPEGTAWHVQEAVFTDRDVAASEKFLATLSRCRASDGVLLPDVAPDDDVSTGAVVAAGSRTVAVAYRWPDSTLAKVTTFTLRDGRWLQIRARAMAGHGSTDPATATRWVLDFSRTAAERLTGNRAAALSLRSDAFRPAAASVLKPLLRPTDLGPVGEWRLAPPEYRDQATGQGQEIQTVLPATCDTSRLQLWGPGLVQGYHARLVNGAWTWHLRETVYTLAPANVPEVKAKLHQARSSRCGGAETAIQVSMTGWGLMLVEGTEYKAWALQDDKLVVVSSSAGMIGVSEPQPEGMDWFRQVVETAVERATT